jgi:putative ABC transport system permease protein
MVKGQQLESEMETEVRFHIESRATDLVRKGLSQQDAIRQARIEFGGIESYKDAMRASVGVRWWGELGSDLHHGWRLLCKNPAFTAVAVLTLALGVGANTAIFSIVNAVLLRSLPFPHPERLVKIVASNRGVGARDIGLSVLELDDLRTRAGVFDQVTAIGGGDANLTGSERPQRLEIQVVSPNYFSMLGTSAHLGRVFGPGDEAQGFAEAIVISDSLWARGFGRDPGILGRKVQLDNDPYTIVGVLPPGFRHPGATVATDVEVWTTAGYRADPFPKPRRSVQAVTGAIGLLKPGISREQAQLRLNAFATQLRAEFPTDYPAGSDWSIEIEPLQESLVGDVRPMLLVLMGAVALIILLASVNVANLLLARASGRQREMAVRLALGASRARLIRQLLTESVILSLVSGLVGVLTAVVALHFAQFLPARIPQLAQVQVDWTVLGFAVLVSLLAGLGFGLVPALQSSKDEMVAMREGARGSGTSAKTNRLRGLLIASESALAVVLMVGAGLLLRTFWGLLQENPGFNPSRIVAANTRIPVPNNPQLNRYAQPENFNTLVREILRRVRALPGVDLASMTTDLPVTLLSRRFPVNIEDRPDESRKGLFSEVTSVTPEYFKVLQAPLVRGRFFVEDDQPGKQPVVIVDESAARTFWPHRDPIGRRLSFGRAATNPPWWNVVGVIKDIKNDGLDQSGTPHIYSPIYQVPAIQGFDFFMNANPLSVTVRTSLSATSLEPQIRGEIETIDPNLPVFGVRTMNEVIDGSLASRRFSAQLVGVFAVVALLLASVGIYGLLAYMVGQRSHEIGVRMALGAMPSAIAKMIVSRGVGLAGIGVVIGLILSGIIDPMFSILLYGVRPFDPEVFLAVPLILMAVVLLASYIPARRAARVDPVVALRES